MYRNDSLLPRFFGRPEMKQPAASRPGMLMIDFPGKSAYGFHELAEFIMGNQATQLSSSSSRTYRVPDHINITVRVGTAHFPVDRGEGRAIEIMISKFSYQIFHVNLCTAG
jgi:hypothetical protein